MAESDVFPDTIFNPSDSLVVEIAQNFDTPCYVTDERTLRKRIELVRTMPAAFDFAPRYAMKAYPLRSILKVLLDCGFGIDASSEYEAYRAEAAGFHPGNVCLTTQQFPRDAIQFLRRGFDVNACSILQLRKISEAFEFEPSLRRPIGVRINPGFGSGHSQRTHVAGPNAGFGIWHEYIPEVLGIAKESGIVISRVHSHIGAGADTAAWKSAALTMLDVIEQFPDAVTLGLGGGFKVRRVNGEYEADLQSIGENVQSAMLGRESASKKRYKLEVEPGTYLAAPISVILARVIDVVDTGPSGYRFIKLDAGMTEIIRPAMYGSQHPIRFISVDGTRGVEEEFLVIGHCCESGDILTTEVGDPELIRPRTFPRPKVGDIAIIGGAGAYCSAMSTHNYNSFPEAAHVFVTQDGTPKLARKRETFEQMLANEE